MRFEGISTKNFQAAVVLFLVALPLNLGVAVSSGVPVGAGIVSGAVGAIIVWMLSGSPLMISGPDAGIGVLILEMIQQLGIDKLGIIVLLAGVLQVILGAFRAALAFRIFSPAVVNGMLGGMGLIIILTQFLIMLDSKPETTGFANLAAIPGVLLKAATPTDGLTHHPAACIGILTIIVALLWNKYAQGFLKKLPAALVAILVASVATTVLHLPIQLIKVPSDFSTAVNVISIQTLLAALTDPAIWTSAATVAFVASTQSLLTAAAVDSAARGKKSNLDKELVAQGVGNIICGALGALPVAGVLLRSMANVQSGATSRSANIIHGVLIVAALLLIPSALNQMPICALAAMLVLIGCRMLNNIRQNIRDYHSSELAIVAITIIAILATNLFTGVLIGFGVAAAKELYSIAYLGIRLDVTEVPGGSILHLWGAATFLHIPRLAAVLDSVPPDADLHVRLDELSHIDHACLELLMDWAQHHREQGGEFFIDWGSFQARYRGNSLSSKYFAEPDAV